MKHVSITRMKRILSWFLTLVLVVPFIGMPSLSYAAAFSDIRGHWAESYINKAVSAGFVKGYPDGTFRPDSSVTRAEFTSMVNKALGNSGTASVTFSDVPYGEWFYSDIAKGISATFVGGYDDNTFRPNNAVTREEAAVMISRFVPTYGVSGSTSSFGDRGSISSWAADAVARINGKGYMGSYDDGRFHPSDSLTRAMTAKILCDILDKETIVSSSATVKSKGTTLSGRIYSNNVTMHADLGDGNAELSNCIVLGTLYVYGGGDDTITVSNSRIANAYVEKSSSSVRLLAKGQTAINKTTAGNTAILETSSLSGGLYGTGFNEVDIKSSAKATLKGSFVKVNLTGSSADVKAESGSITTLNVSSSGRNSEITLDSKSSINTANVNAAAAFRGTGTINTMYANSSGVTYETKPKYLKSGSGVSSPDQKGNDGDNSDLEIAVSPKNGATKVALDTEITLTFDKAVKKYNGSTIKDSDIEDMVSLRRGSSSGGKVSFDATINSSKKVITLTPEDDLDEDTKYYIVIPKKEFLYSNDEANSAQTTSFKTGDDTDSEVTFSPKKNVSDVSLSVSPTITFDHAIETYAGKDITEAYLKDNIIFKEGSSSGSKVSFTATISSSNKKITIEPGKKLKEGQKYYLSIPDKKFRTSSGKEAIGESSVTWTTTKPTAPAVTFTPDNNAGNVALDTKIIVKFSDTIYNSSGTVPIASYMTSNITMRDNTSPGSVTLVNPTYNNSSITLSPSQALKPGHSYTVKVAASRFRNSSGLYAVETSATFIAERNMDLSSLNSAISSAEATRKGIQISTNGADVYEGLMWVTQAQWDELNNAITTANSALKTVATTTEAKAAADDLNKKTETFKNNRKPGTKFRANTSALELAISDAKSVAKGVSISTDGFDISPSKKWVTQDLLTTLNNAIAAAEKDMDKISTYGEVAARTDALNQAIKDFKSASKDGYMADKTSLKSAIKSAKDAQNDVRRTDSGADVPVGSKWAPASVHDALNQAITAAQNVVDNRTATPGEVDKARTDLEAATTTFKDQLKDGEKPLPPTE